MGYDAVETVGQRDWPERVARPPFCRGCARDGRAVGAITAATCGCPGAQGEVVWMQQMSHNRIRCAARILPFLPGLTLCFDCCMNCTLRVGAGTGIVSLVLAALLSVTSSTSHAESCLLSTDLREFVTFEAVGRPAGNYGPFTFFFIRSVFDGTHVPQHTFKRRALSRLPPDRAPPRLGRGAPRNGTGRSRARWVRPYCVSPTHATLFLY